MNFAATKAEALVVSKIAERAVAMAQESMECFTSTWMP